MTATPTIRRATLGDVEALTSLRLALLREIGNIPDEARAATLVAATRHYLLRKLGTGEFIAWVADVSGQLVATSGLVFFERPPDAGNPAGLDAYLMNMYTVPDWRRRGLARALLDEAIQFTRRSTARRIWLRATEGGEPIYRQAGFVSASSDLELHW